MSDLQARLSKCFAAVFPQLDENQIRQASLGAVEGWDSVATVTLLTVIEEEFGVQFGPEDLERLVSYESIKDYLSQAQNTH